MNAFLTPHTSALVAMDIQDEEPGQRDAGSRRHPSGQSVQGLQQVDANEKLHRVDESDNLEDIQEVSEVDEDDEDDESCLEIDLNAIGNLPLAPTPPISFQSHVLRKTASTPPINMLPPSPAHSSPGPTCRSFNAKEKDQLTSLLVSAISKIKANAVASPISPHSSSRSVRPTVSSSTNCGGDNGTNMAEVLTSSQVESLHFKSLWNLFPVKKRPKMHNLLLLSEFGSLKSLELGDHVVQTLDGLDHFRQLECLLLPRNHLRNIELLCRDTLGIHATLRVLDLSGNFIGHIPRHFDSLEALEKLNLSGNNLSILKEVDLLSEMANLFECSFSGNPFCKLPTYRVYVISKLRCLEKLDESIITSQIRAQSQRRFDMGKLTSDNLEKKHQLHQEKLQQAQLQLEEENSRLKNELQLKSKLLQNKSVEWSTATQKLLQLQQEIDMLRIEETSTHSAVSGLERRSKLKKRRSSGKVKSSTTATTTTITPSPTRESVETTPPEEEEIHSTRATASLAQCDRNHHDSPPHQATKPRSGLDSVRRAFAKLSPHDAAEWDEREESKQGQRASPTLSSCYGSPPPSKSISPSTSCSVSPRSSPPSPLSPLRTLELSPRFRQDEKRDRTNKPPSPLQKLFVRPGETILEWEGKKIRRSRSRSRVVSSAVRSRSPSPRSLAPKASTPRQASPDSLTANNTLSIENSEISSHKPLTKRSPTTTQPAALPREGLPESAKLTPSETLHLRKQSLLMEIAREEKILHELNQQSDASRYEINVLTSTVHDQMLQLASLSPKSHQKQKAEAVAALEREREEELEKRMNYEELQKRKRLQMLEGELSFAQIKEKQIERTIVHITEGVIQQHSQEQLGNEASSASFEKEIFGLTHKLQSVITRREELALEISRLKMELQHPSNLNSDGWLMPTTVPSSPTSPSKQFASHKDAEEIQLKTKADVKRLEMLKRRLGDLDDRIKAKEQLLSMMIQEIKDIDALLEQMNETGTIQEGELAPVSTTAPSSSPTPPSQTDQLPSSPASPGSSPKPTKTAEQDSCSEENRCESTKKRSKSLSSSEPRRSHSPISRRPSEAMAPPDECIELTSSALEQQDPPQLSEQQQGEQEQSSPPLDLQRFVTEEMLMQIKKDVCDKLLAQFVDGPQAFWHKPDAAAHTIQEAVEAQLKQLQAACPHDVIGEPPNSEVDQSVVAPETNAAEQVESEQQIQVQEPNTRELNVKEFDARDAVYHMKYRLVRRLEAATSTRDGKTVTSRVTKPFPQEQEAASTRIYKACERLDSLQEETLLDRTTNIEKDVHGHLKSTLKVFVMAARDLETNHLRTKNLDPYVTLEVLPAHQHENETYIGQLHRSKTKKRTVYPIWQEEFGFAPVTSLGDLLRIRVANDRKQNASRHQIIGEANIPISSLIHQKRVTDWFPLTLPTSNGSSLVERRGSQFHSIRDPSSLTGGAKSLAGSRIHNSPLSASCKDRNGDAGAIRLQLQLQFSRVEKLKRTIDEMIEKYLATFNQLPYGVTLVEQQIIPILGDGDEAKMQDEMVWPAMTGVDDSGQTSQIASEDSTKDLGHGNQMETESPNQVLGIKEKKSPESQLQTLEETESQNQQNSLNDSRELRLEDLDTSNKSTQPSACISNQQSVEKPKLTINTNLCPAIEGINKVESVAGSVMTPKKLASDGVEFSVLSNLQEERAHSHHSNQNQPRPVCCKQLKSPTSRKTPCKPSPLTGFYQHPMPMSPHSKFFHSTPDCFDEDSIYHPYHFHLKAHAGLTSGLIDHETDKKRQRKTNLSIFRSPNFARREPTQPFPERFIGLDTQTSERHKQFIQRLNPL